MIFNGFIFEQSKTPVRKIEIYNYYLYGYLTK